MTDEIARRLVHASGTLVPAAYLLDRQVMGLGLVTWRVVQGAFVLGAVIALVLEALRLQVGLDWAIYDRLTREYEAHNPAGYALYMIGAAIVTVVFDPQVAIPAVLMLTIGDPVSGLLSSSDVEGTKGGVVMAITFLLCLGLALPFLPVRAAVPAALAAVVADAVKPVIAGYVVDDNISIPLGAAVAGFVFLRYVPALA